MKGIQGLIVAAGLGVAGALLNYFYLAGKANEIAMVSFIGVKPGLVVGRGERLVPSSLVEVKIPKNAKGNLEDYAFLWTEKAAVENQVTWRTLADEDHATLMLREDIKTPQKTLELGERETAMWIPVDSPAFVPSLVKPGDWVSFKVPLPRSTAAAPVPVALSTSGIQKPDDPDNVNPPTPLGPTETIGRFKVLSVGNRLGSAEVMRSAKIPQLQENVLTIRVSKNETGEVERAEKLWDRLHAVNFRQVGIILHGKP